MPRTGFDPELLALSTLYKSEGIVQIYENDYCRDVFIPIPGPLTVMKTIPELREVVLKMEDQRTKLGQDIGTARVDLSNMEQMRHEAKSEGFTLTVDEPPQRGGTNMGLHPLGYFIVGAASCFLTQMAKITIIKNLKIDSMEITARAHYDRAKTRAFIDMIYDVRLTGSESHESAIELLYEAEKNCFVHQTLKKVIPITSNLSLNGTPVTSHTIGGPA